MEIMRLEEINIKKDFEEWNSIVINSPDFYTIANNPSLINFLDKTLKWAGKSYFILQNNEVIGVYQNSFVSKNKIVSTPHFSYGGIIRKNETFTKKEIFKNISHFFNSSFEIRDFEPYTKYFNDSKIATYLKLEASEDEQMAVFKSNHRRKIKKAYKNDLEVKNQSSTEFMLEFYKVYSKNMLRLGSPCLSKHFFLNLLKYYRYGDVRIFLVYKNNKVIGGAVVLTYNKFVEDCWLSTLSEYNNLYSSVLLYWEMIKYSIKNNKEIFSFGRSTNNSSLLKFKRQWKPIEKKIYFSYSEKKKISLKKISFLATLWKFMPLSIANFLGPKIANKLY